jgi:hypothetical protein
MRQRRQTNYEQLLDRLQEEAEQGDEPRGILELFDVPGREAELDADAALERDDGQ